MASQVSSRQDSEITDAIETGIDLSDLPVTAQSLVAAARLLLVPRPRLKMISLGQPLQVPAMIPFGAADGESARATLKRICGPAAVCLRQAIELDPEYAEAHSLLADVYEDLGHLDAAIGCRRRALALVPDDRAEQMALAQLLLLAERLPEAAQATAAVLPAVSGETCRAIPSLCFEDWAAEQGAPLRHLSPSSTFRYEFQAYLDGKLIPAALDVRPARPCVAEVKSLTLFRGFLPVAQNGSFIEGAVQDGRGFQLPGVQVATENAVVVDGIGADETIDGPCLVLCGLPMHYRNYFHAVAQNFIRLPLILRDPEYAGLPLVVPEMISAWGEDFLAAIGVSKDRLIYVKHDRNTLIHHALVPSPPTRLRVPGIEEAEALRATLFADDPVPERRNRLFVSRAALAQNLRELTNEEALQEIALEHGFTLIDPGKMSILEQVKAFSQAAAVCGASGAGLANFLYAPEGATTICFSARETCRSFFVNLSAITRQRFTWCLGSFLPEAAPSRRFPHLPYTVREDDFRGLLRALDDRGGRP